MIERQYHIVFTLALGHDYFADGRFETAQITPTPETAKLLRSRRMLVRQQPGTLIVLVESRPENGAPRKPVRDAALKLEFALACADPDFSNYTDLPRHTPRSGTFVFGNTPGPQTRAAAERIRQAQLAAGQPVPAAPGFTATTLADADLRLSAADQAGEADFSPEDRLRGAFGIVVIETGALPTDGAPTYTLDFGTRDVTWRYHIVQRNDTTEESFAITNGKSNIKFNEKGTFPLPDGSSARVYEADATLPFQEEGMPIFSLRQATENGAGNGQVLIGSLPRPRYQDLKLEKTSESPRDIAEVYVYV